VTTETSAGGMPAPGGGAPSFWPEHAASSPPRVIAQVIERAREKWMLMEVSEKEGGWEMAREAV
jgi:hypothetical protein